MRLTRHFISVVSAFIRSCPARSSLKGQSSVLKNALKLYQKIQTTIHLPSFLLQYERLVKFITIRYSDGKIYRPERL